MKFFDASNDTSIQIAQIVPHTAAEGPGWRFAIWLQGCPFRCPGCCNPEMLSYEGGKSTKVQEIIDQVDLMVKKTQGTDRPLEGITLLGGEPFAHASGAAVLAQKVQQMDLSVMIFSGYTIEQLRAADSPEVDRLLAGTDILVDGTYEKEMPDSTRRWIGSTNQRIHFMTERYNQFDSSWDKQDTLEIRLNGDQLTVNGFPASQAVGVWKRPKRK